MPPPGVKSAIACASHRSLRPLQNSPVRKARPDRELAAKPEIQRNFVRRPLDQYFARAYVYRRNAEFPLIVVPDFRGIMNRNAESPQLAVPVNKTDHIVG